MASELDWIKLSTDIFDDDKFHAIETNDDGFLIELVWIKILCLAGKCNKDGFLMVSEKVPYTVEMLSSKFRMDELLIKNALDVLSDLSMIEKVGKAYMVSNWLLHQSEKGIDEIRQKARERQKRYRERQKSNVTSDVISDVTHLISESKSDSLSETYKEIVDYLNKKVGSHYQYTTGKTQRCIKARINEGFTVDDFKTVIDKKVNDWLKDKEMVNYLRPETLFGTKFESYLNQKGGKTVGKQQSNDDVSKFWGNNV